MKYTEGAPIEPRTGTAWRVTLPDGTTHLQLWHTEATIEDVHRQNREFFPEFRLGIAWVGDYIVRTEHAYTPDGREVDQDWNFAPLQSGHGPVPPNRRFLFMRLRFPSTRGFSLVDVLNPEREFLDIVGRTDPQQRIEQFRAWLRTCRNGDTFHGNTFVVICIVPETTIPIPSPETPP